MVTKSQAHRVISVGRTVFRRLHSEKLTVCPHADELGCSKTENVRAKYSAGRAKYQARSSNSFLDPNSRPEDVLGITKKGEINKFGTDTVNSVGERFVRTLMWGRLLHESGPE